MDPAEKELRLLSIRMTSGNKLPDNTAFALGKISVSFRLIT